MQVAAGASPVALHRSIRLAVVAGMVVGFDQATKAWAVSALDGGRTIEIVGDTVQLDLVRNTGGAFSLFTGVAPVLALIALVLVVYLVRLARQEDDRVLSLGLALVLGGALGNLGDRVFRDPGVLEGAVVDFVDVGAWPTFNVADAAITIGAAILLLRGWRAGRGESRGASDEQ